jgi:hypothetical protein
MRQFCWNRDERGENHVLDMISRVTIFNSIAESCSSVSPHQLVCMCLCVASLLRLRRQQQHQPLPTGFILILVFSQRLPSARLLFRGAGFLFID